MELFCTKPLQLFLVWNKLACNVVQGPISFGCMPQDLQFYKVSLEEEWGGILSKLRSGIKRLWEPCPLLVLVRCIFSVPKSAQTHPSGTFRVLNVCFCWQVSWCCWFFFFFLPVKPGAWLLTQRKVPISHLRIEYFWAWLASKLGWPKTYRICHRLIAPMPHCTDTVINKKRVPAKFWTHNVSTLYGHLFIKLTFLY